MRTGNLSAGNPAIINLSKRKFEAEAGPPQMSIDSSTSPEIMTEPKPQKQVRFADAAEVGADFYKPQLDKKQQPVPQEVIDKIADYIEAGCTIPILRFVAPNPREQTPRCIDKVLPALRA